MLVNKKSKIFIAGHNGMVGSAILKHLKVYAGNDHPHKSQNPERLEF